MAFYTGNFSSFASLKSSVETALQANGWSLSSDVLSKAGMFLKLTAATEELTAEAGTGSSGGDITGAAPLVKLLDPTDSPINFPATYDLHINTGTEEVFLVVSYNADKYQQLSWGKSRVEQVDGSGMWITGSFSAAEYANSLVYMAGDHYHVGSSFSGQGLGLFAQSYNAPQCSFVHTGLDEESWKTVGAYDGDLTGSGDCMAALLQSLPSQFNQNTVLLPLYAVQRRLSNGQTIVVDMEHARLCRIDNHLAGEIVEYGGDNWKVYPFHRKNADDRNGIPWSTGGNHSGTFGFAVRYTGA